MRSSCSSRSSTPLEKQQHAATIKQSRKWLSVRSRLSGTSRRSYSRASGALEPRADAPRLGIQAFEPVLVEGKAIKIHPLSARLSTPTLTVTRWPSTFRSRRSANRSGCIDAVFEQFSVPASGQPIAVRSQDIVLGIYYLTRRRKAPRARAACSGRWKSFPRPRLAICNHATPIKLRVIGDLIDLTPEHDTQDILRGVVQEM